MTTNPLATDSIDKDNTDILKSRRMSEHTCYSKHDAVLKFFQTAPPTAFQHIQTYRDSYVSALSANSQNLEHKMCWCGIKKR